MSPVVAARILGTSVMRRRLPFGQVSAAALIRPTIGGNRLCGQVWSSSIAKSHPQIC
jgi:hypothetical protein